ncbi:MAG: pyridoxamine 5'-phosphate oxidase family protein [Elusimicrobia bacterium]|nr:pyridoxamine 5'-phosphate oxidase family protein [Elusimicrobiota bacterium]
MSPQQSKLADEIRGFFPSPHRAIAILATVDAERDFAPETRPMTLMESGWHFYVATGAGTRKAREMRTHAKVAALVTFRNEKFSGYLRLSGSAEPVDDPSERKRIADSASYNLECRWKGGAGDPDLAFFHIVPERIEYMRPGDDDANDVTNALLGASCPGAEKAGGA